MVRECVYLTQHSIYICARKDERGSAEIMEIIEVRVRQLLERKRLDALEQKFLDELIKPPSVYYEAGGSPLD